MVDWPTNAFSCSGKLCCTAAQGKDSEYNNNNFLIRGLEESKIIKLAAKHLHSLDDDILGAFLIKSTTLPIKFPKFTSVDLSSLVLRWIHRLWHTNDLIFFRTRCLVRIQSVLLPSRQRSLYERAKSISTLVFVVATWSDAATVCDARHSMVYIEFVERREDSERILQAQGLDQRVFGYLIESA